MLLYSMRFAIKIEPKFSSMPSGEYFMTSERAVAPIILAKVIRLIYKDGKDNN